MPQQQPGSYQGGEMMESVFWWRKPEYPEETTDLRQVTDETIQLDIKKVGQFLAKSIDKALWCIGHTCGSRCKK